MLNIFFYQYSADLVWQKAGKHLIEKLEKEKKENKRILLFLSGGSVVQLYGQLAKLIREGDFKSNQLTITQVDERYSRNQKTKINKDWDLRALSLRGVPTVRRDDAAISVIEIASSSTRNDKLNRNLLRNFYKDINAENIRQTGLWEACKEKKIPYHLISQEGTLEGSAEGYNKIISKLFSRYDFKMAILGIGKDCHTAGLIPGFEKSWNINDYVVGYKLDSNHGQNSAAAEFCQQKSVKNSIGRINKRITLTPFALKQLDYALVGVVGEEKREALKNALNPDNREKLDQYPAAIIQKIKKVDVITPLKSPLM